MRIHPDFVRFLLERGATVHMKDRRGHTPLHSATQSVVFSAETLDILLEADASVEERDADGHTPLHHAGIVSSVLLLLLLFFQPDEINPSCPLNGQCGIRVLRRLTSSGI